MKNQGTHTHRLSSNPMERIFAEEWDRLNGDAINVLEYIVQPIKPGWDQYSMLAENVDDETRKKAASIIQWLGSPIGQSFLRTVLKRAQTEAPDAICYPELRVKNGEG